jgi:hypothetical protein
MLGCGAGMTIGSGTSKTKRTYYYYKCNEKTHIGQRCTCPTFDARGSMRLFSGPSRSAYWALAALRSC